MAFKKNQKEEFTLPTGKGQHKLLIYKTNKEAYLRNENYTFMHLYSLSLSLPSCAHTQAHTYTVMYNKDLIFKQERERERAVS